MRTLYRAVPLNAAIRASNLIGTLFNGVRVPATNINFRSPPKKKKKNECGTKLFHKICLFSSSSRPQSVSRGLHLCQAAVCETVVQWKKAVNQADPDTSKSNTEPFAAPGSRKGRDEQGCVDAVVTLRDLEAPSSGWRCSTADVWNLGYHVFSLVCSTPGRWEPPG